MAESHLQRATSEREYYKSVCERSRQSLEEAGLTTWRYLFTGLDYWTGLLDWPSFCAVCLKFINYSNILFHFYTIYSLIIINIICLLYLFLTSIIIVNCYFNNNLGHAYF